MEEAVIPSTLQWFSRQPPAIVRQRRGTCYRTGLPCTSGAFASARHGRLCRVGVASCTVPCNHMNHFICGSERRTDMARQSRQFIRALFVSHSTPHVSLVSLSCPLSLLHGSCTRTQMTVILGVSEAILKNSICGRSVD